MTEKCPFCTLPDERIIDLGYSCVLALRDGYPVSKGHTLIIPRRHIATWFDATPAERMELWTAIDTVCDQLRQEFSPAGFNFGINSGEAAGQTVPHLHLHVIPRYHGDMDDPRGGVRHVIPSMGNYKHPDFGATNQIRDGEDPAYNSSPTRARPSLFTNARDNQLLLALQQDISRANKLDIAVAFVYRSGLNRLRPHVTELLEKDGRFRLLTGNYLNATDPDALQELLDLRSAYPQNCNIYVYNSDSRSFHPKSYLLFNANGEHIAYVGSSNLSRTALSDGVEWNLRLTDRNDDNGWRQITSEFDQLLKDPNVEALSDEWLARYRKTHEEQRRDDSQRSHGPPPEPGLAPPVPNEIQQEALAALQATRTAGNRAGLVVMGTGLGKTWLAAFDVASDTTAFGRVLFVAHREEILKQSLATFRRINPQASMGYYTGNEKQSGANILFASIQTLSRTTHLQKFLPTEFDYIVVDEFHHAAANTYRRLIDYFHPKFLLGLTATPERTDGGDLLTLCDQNLVYRCDLTRGINLGLLSRFNYFGVPDNVNYENIPWRSRKFDEAALTQAVETIDRAENIYQQWLQRGKQRTMAFCVSQSHANFMRDWFRQKGVRCAAVHSGGSSDARALSLDDLEAGKLQIVFAIDMFNEGVDIPALDTIMMLRPTESAIIWLQQFGRGLRKQQDKILTVIDYIGNHRSFLVKLRSLLGMQRAGPAQLRIALGEIENGTWPLPDGCGITYDLQSIEILRQLLPAEPPANALAQYYSEFKEQHGQRPTATETYQDGCLPGSAKSSYGSWLDFVHTMGDLSPVEQQALDDHRVLINGLETTSMTRSYKMILLRAMLNTDTLPGPGATLDQLADEVIYLAERSNHIATDFGDALSTKAKLKSSLQSNPINAWTGDKALRGPTAFSFENQTFRYTPAVKDEHRVVFQSLVRELIEWRLAVYLDRTEDKPSNSTFTMRVSHANKKPILFLPPRDTHPHVPFGWQIIRVDNRQLYFNFVKVAVNVAAEQEEGNNILPTLLRGWFGPDAGLPGTQFQVRCERNQHGWRLEPVQREQDTKLVLHKRYAREQIPVFFGEEFNTGKWNSGHIPSPTADPKHIILLVTLEKAGMQGEHQYADRFLSDTVFQWQSQNATSQASKKGQQLRDHMALGLTVHLFVRETRKTGGIAAPFTYLGEVEFESWEGEKPVTVNWRLKAMPPPTLLQPI